MYKLQGEFGDELYSGTKQECKMIKKAMVKYGIAERKLHIIEPEDNELVIPENIKNKLEIDYIDCRAENMDKWDYVQWEVENMSDLEFFREYEDYMCVDEDDEPNINVEMVRDIIASNALMRAETRQYDRLKNH